MDIADILESTERFVVAATAADWETAGRHVGPDPVFVFPTGRFGSLSELAASIGGRYRSIEKVIDLREAWVRGDGTIGVCLGGTLRGVNMHDRPFEGVRFLDLLIVSDEGTILEQHVHNDLVISGVLEAR